MGKFVKYVTFIISLIAIMLSVFSLFGCHFQHGSISGHIYMSDGSEIGDETEIICTPLDRNVFITTGDPAPSSLIVRATGYYSINNLPESSYRIWARNRTNQLYSEKPIIVTVKNRQNTSWDIILIPGGTISGRVHNINPEFSGDKPVSILVEYWPTETYYISETFVRDDGTFTVAGVAPGQILVVATYKEYSGPPGTSYQPARDKITVHSREEVDLDLTFGVDNAFGK